MEFKINQEPIGVRNVASGKEEKGMIKEHIITTG